MRAETASSTAPASISDVTEDIDELGAETSLLLRGEPRSRLHVVPEVVFRKIL
jgi:hypothetical protein